MSEDALKIEVGMYFRDKDDNVYRIIEMAFLIMNQDYIEHSMYMIGMRIAQSIAMMNLM